VKEFSRYDESPARFQKIEVEEGRRKVTVDVGYERFLAPEIFFNPEIASSDFLTPLPEVVDNVIQVSPIDVRRGLYKVSWIILVTDNRILSCQADPLCSRISEEDSSETSNRLSMLEFTNPNN